MGESLASCIFYIEKNCSQRITKDYPLMKFFSLLRNLEDYVKEKNKQMNK